MATCRLTPEQEKIRPSPDCFKRLPAAAHQSAAPVSGVAAGRAEHIKRPGRAALGVQMLFLASQLFIKPTESFPPFSLMAL